ncbi:MAG: hypothetical protein ACRD3W_10310, partial [Terriglobales bacterium]
ANPAINDSLRILKTSASQGFVPTVLKRAAAPKINHAEGEAPRSLLSSSVRSASNQAKPCEKLMISAFSHLDMK